MTQQLSPTDFKDRVRAIAEAAGIAFDVPADRCWVEGRIRCPYGSPEGQYVLRPEGFCGQDCHTYADNVHDDELDVEARNDAVRAHFDEEKTSVTAELRARADEIPDGPEAQVLSLAADLLEEKKMDREILLEDDLPAERK